jgi:hypothetical protein
MSFSSLINAAFLAVLGASAAAHAQEGYPLDGTWRGSLRGADGAQSAIVIVMKWDGKSINGIVNPGRRAASFTAAELDPRDWTVRFATTVVDATGTASPVVIEGTLANLGSYHRTITGSWTQAGATQPFTLTRE